ncbi:helix-turn-helix domain-containing protein [Flavobacterium sp.]|uniref:helix-turn-helix domain-containing protein n=1 Tax=Flavobacterium sp. TaxID=239 RepID=UPI0025C053E5|nr:helix-turn-helix domain-containing protein [Flavobacterium sp.]MBA4155705.1 DNA-binding protein [Flavobacterium sp.]
MTKSVLQIETVNEKEFTDKILTGVQNLLDRFASSAKDIETDKLLTREETAKLLSVSLTTLWDYTRKDIVPAYRIGTKVRYKKSEVLSALQKMNQLKINKS